MQSNLKAGVIIPQPKTFSEREQVATSCSLDLNLTIPMLLDEMDNAVNQAYGGGSPERLYVMDVDGRVTYQGRVGPHFFDPDQWERAIDAVVAQSARPAA